MKSSWLVVLAVGLGAAAGAAGVAGAKAAPKIAGDYDVKVTAVANTCGDSGVALGAETLTVTQKGKALTGAIAVLPIMKGALKDTGKFELATKRGRSPIEGLKAEFRMTGTFIDGKVTLVLVARYFMGSNPHCEQSWNGTGGKKK